MGFQNYLSHTIQLEREASASALLKLGKLSNEEIAEACRLTNAEVETLALREPRTYHIGEVYRHFRGGRYRLLEVATDTENGDEVAVYASMENGKVWCCPLYEFLAPVDREEYPEEHKKWKFEEM